MPRTKQKIAQDATDNTLDIEDGVELIIVADSPVTF